MLTKQILCSENLLLKLIICIFVNKISLMINTSRINIKGNASLKMKKKEADDNNWNYFLKVK